MCINSSPLKVEMFTRQKIPEVTLALFFALSLLGGCKAGFNESMAELFPEFSALDVIPDPVGVIAAQNTGGYLINNGFDFGGHAEAATGTLLIENRSNRLIAFDSYQITGADASAFSLVSSLPLVLYERSQLEVALAFAPDGGPARAYQARLVLSNKEGRQLDIALEAASYAQPRDSAAWDKLALWLRSDRIRLDDLLATTDFTENAQLAYWSDYGGRGLRARTEASQVLLESGNVYPRLIPNSHNGIPGIRFSGTELLVVDVPSNIDISSGDTGTTTIIVFKTGEAATWGKYRLLTPTMGENTQDGFPVLDLREWFFDPVDGLYGYDPPYINKAGQPQRPIRFDLHGYGWDGNPRSPYDSATAQVQNSTVYYLSFVCGPVVPGKSNVFMWRNGEATRLSYLHSNPGNKYVGDYPNEGAYGFPISSGDGLRNPEVWGETGALVEPGERYQYDYVRNFSVTPPNSLFFNILSESNYRIHDLYLGRRPESLEKDGFRGDLYEVMIFSQPLAEEDLAIIHTYLKNRYGL